MTKELSISRKQFIDLFPGKESVYDTLSNTPASVSDLINKFLPSRLWRLNNLYTIIDKHGNAVKFQMNRAQFIVHSASYIHPRLIILKSRQQGISTYELIDTIDEVLFRSFRTCGLMAQGADEASKLLERTKFTWEQLSPDVKSFLGRKLLRDNTKEVTFNNDSTIFIRTSFRSATLHRLHISEYGKIANKYPERARETKTGTLQTIASGNRVVLESTAEGHNDFKSMWDSSFLLRLKNKQFAPKDFYPVFLSWLDDPYCYEPMQQELTKDAIEYFDYLRKELNIVLSDQQQNFWIMQYRELGGDIYQEYPATPEEAFRASKDGTFWAKKYIAEVIRKRHKIPKLFDRRLDLYAFIDLGMHDYFVITFVQIFEHEIRFVGEFWHNGQDISYYCDYLLNELPDHWNVKTVYLPHDANVRSLTTRGAKTREEIFWENGIENTEVLPKLSKADGIALVRQEMPNVFIDEDCPYLEQCFLGYSKKWDPKLQKWSDDDDDTEERHGADTIRYAVETAVRMLRTSKPAPRNNDGDLHSYSDDNVVDGVAM